jgi:hypothetical protein
MSEVGHEKCDKHWYNCQLGLGSGTKNVTKVHYVHNILPIYSNKSMGFASKKVWVMGYQRVMGYGSQIPAYQLGGLKILWVMGEYGLSGLWVKRESTLVARTRWQ